MVFITGEARSLTAASLNTNANTISMLTDTEDALCLK